MEAKDLRQQPLPQRKQRILCEPWVRIRMFQIQSIAIELADSRSGNHNAIRVFGRCKNIQCGMHSIAKGLGG
jgi:hypothetical protein